MITGEISSFIVYNFIASDIKLPMEIENIA